MTAPKKVFRTPCGDECVYDNPDDEVWHIMRGFQTSFGPEYIEGRWAVFSLYDTLFADDWCFEEWEIKDDRERGLRMVRLNTLS